MTDNISKDPETIEEAMKNLRKAGGEFRDVLKESIDGLTNLINEQIDAIREGLENIGETLNPPEQDQEPCDDDTIAYDILEAMERERERERLRQSWKKPKGKKRVHYFR